MNIQRWKGLAWLGSAAVGGYLLYYVVDFLRRKDTLARVVPNEEIAAVLDGVKRPAEQKADVVQYTSIKRIFHDHDWTGKERVKPVVQPDGEKPPPVPKVAVVSLLKVMAIKVDLTKPERSVAYVKYVDGKLAVHTASGDNILHQEAWPGPGPDTRPGHSRLFAPYQDIRVEAITREGVVFAFDDPAREREVVQTSPYQSAQRGDLGIVVVGPEGAIMPPQRQFNSITPAAPWRPEELTQLRKNEWQVGTGTLADLERDYSRILSRDISCSAYKDPRTGATEGIKINRVAPNSIPAQAGLSEGEVLKSINGHKVTSVNDAIAFVKANVNSTDTWTAVFEKQGREITRTYHSPPR